jgi:hypothetical protein
MVIGCSRLDEIITDKPPALYQTFRHLGVWRRDQIAQVAHNGVALALRFADTEIFPHQISLERLRHLERCQTPFVRSPRKIIADLFAAIYREGQSYR